MAKVWKCPCHHVAGVGGQYKMYNSLIFINFISRSKKVEPKSKSCIKHLFTVNKLLRLWYFVSVLNLQFLDQLERRHCKDIPFFRPFYIGAPKGPFLWGFNQTTFFRYHFPWDCPFNYELSVQCGRPWPPSPCWRVWKRGVSSPPRPEWEDKRTARRRGRSWIPYF